VLIISLVTQKPKVYRQRILCPYNALCLQNKYRNEKLKTQSSNLQEFMEGSWH